MPQVGTGGCRGLSHAQPQHASHCLGKGCPVPGEPLGQDGSKPAVPPSAPVVSPCVGTASGAVAAGTPCCPHGEVAFNHPLRCSGDQSQRRSLIREGAQGCSSPCTKRLKLSPWLPPSLLALGAEGDPWGHPEQEGMSRPQPGQSWAELGG